MLFKLHLIPPKPFQACAVFYVETSHLICSVNTGLEWAKVNIFKSCGRVL